MPAITFSRVVLPDPLWPISPSDSPSRTSKLTSQSAQKSSAREREVIIRAFKDDGFSRYRRNRFETCSTSIADSAIAYNSSAKSPDRWKNLRHV
jgi:hypothetical protein